MFSIHNLKDAHVIDIVQGCAGGVTALLLASQLASIHRSKVLVVMADAARKACDKDSKNYENFGNGSFACIIEGGNYQTRLIHFKSKQYKELLEVVHVRLGHDADEVLAKGITINHNPRKYLGLEMKNELAIKLLQQAKSFYEDFVSEVNIEPDMIILHQVNPKIIKYLEGVFLKEKISFVNVADRAGNCGTASVGIALKHAESDLKGKKVFICSFGTGGVITAGLWQY
jgi:3-oxoacyl-[acyl-carrier-protein] synthase III